MLAAIGSALLALIMPPVAPEPVVAAEPAIYAVRDADTTVYIFGTFHVLRGNIHWFDGPVERAFGEAEQLVVETIPPDQAAQALPSPAPLGPIAPAASFLNSTQQAVRAGEARGMALANGADMVLLRAAAAAGKKVEPLETVAAQLTMITRIPSEGSVAAAADAPTLDDQMVLLEAAWSRGDHGLFAAMLSDMRTSSPAAYRLMFTERNARWTDWVAARMRTPGTVFVAVGAGHLAGPDSLLVRLAQRGHISRRVF